LIQNIHVSKEKEDKFYFIKENIHEKTLALNCYLVNTKQAFELITTVNE